MIELTGECNIFQIILQTYEHSATIYLNELELPHSKSKQNIQKYETTSFR